MSSGKGRKWEGEGGREGAGSDGWRRRRKGGGLGDGLPFFSLGIKGIKVRFISLLRIDFPAKFGRRE